MYVYVPEWRASLSRPVCRLRCEFPRFVRLFPAPCLTKFLRSSLFFTQFFFNSLTLSDTRTTYDNFEVAGFGQVQPPPACLHVHASRPFPPSDAAV